MQCMEHNYKINYKANILEDNVCAGNFSAFCEEKTRVFHELNGSGVLTQPLLAGWLGPGWLSESESYLIEQLSTNFLLSPEKERDEYKCTIKNIEQKKCQDFELKKELWYQQSPAWTHGQGN